MGRLKYLNPQTGTFSDVMVPESIAIDMYEFRKAFFPNMNEYEVANAEKLAPMVFETMNVLNGALVPVKDDKGEITLPSRVQMLVRARADVVLSNSTLFQKNHTLMDELRALEKKHQDLVEVQRATLNRNVFLEGEVERLEAKVKRTTHSEQVARQKLKRAQQKTGKK